MRLAFTGKDDLLKVVRISQHGPKFRVNTFTPFFQGHTNVPGFSLCDAGCVAPCMLAGAAFTTNTQAELDRLLTS